MPTSPTPVPAHHLQSPAPRPTLRRSSQWALEFGDGGGMPVHPPLPPKATRHSERGFARWAVATAFVAALVLGMAVELLPTRAPEAGAVDAAAKAVDAVAVRMEAAAAQLQRLAQGDRS